MSEKEIQRNSGIGKARALELQLELQLGLYIERDLGRNKRKGHAVNGRPWRFPWPVRPDLFRALLPSSRLPHALISIIFLCLPSFFSPCAAVLAEDGVVIDENSNHRLDLEQVLHVSQRHERRPLRPAEQRGERLLRSGRWLVVGPELFFVFVVAAANGAINDGRGWREARRGEVRPKMCGEEWGISPCMRNTRAKEVWRGVGGQSVCANHPPFGRAFAYSEGPVACTVHTAIGSPACAESLLCS